jgi:hypothetical protein
MYQYKIQTLYTSLFLGVLLLGVNTHATEDKQSFLNNGILYLAISPLPLFLRDSFKNAKMIPFLHGHYGRAAFLSATSNLFGRFCLPVISVGLAGKGVNEVYKTYCNNTNNPIDV